MIAVVAPHQLTVLGLVKPAVPVEEDTVSAAFNVEALETEDPGYRRFE
jgi:hypothetical protein